MKLINISRSKIELLLDNNKSMIIQGEAMMIRPITELSEYVIYKNSIKWKNLKSKDNIDNKLINDILCFIQKELEKRNMKMIVE
ncbi:hypothetical protein [Phocaeicola faecicola]|uniref:hypothetical protein n=1 Tax=Phocaeicola faecicola TaxID=2739389 RepID=UPI0015E78FFC|nr:hypothetical protein [Phocaeicola faecicola]